MSLKTAMKPFSPLRYFFLALTFLTRLGRPIPVTPDDLGRTLPFFPLIGLVVAAGSVGPVYVLHLLGVGRGLPWLLALILCGCSFIITRGLHWDGWADIWDAWGSGTTGDRFWEILKDSRLGAFGALGLFFGLAGQLILIEHALLTRQWIVLLWAFVHGRAGAVFLAQAGRSLARPGLAQAFLAGAGPIPTLLALIQTLALGLACLSWPRMMLALSLTGLGGLALYLLARKNSGLNGDFLGAMMIWSESAALLSLIPVA